MSIPKALRDRLLAGNVIPFVGAGVSMSVRNAETGERLFPSWHELLEQAASRLEEEDRVPYALTVRGLLALDKPDYLDAARRAREGLGESIWYTFLKDQLDSPRERAKPESLRLAEAIWKLNSQLIITTNYDDVLRWASPSHPVLWDTEAPAEMAAFLRSGTKRPTVWHLHGHIHNTSKIILTRDGYARLYPEANESEAEEYYRAALQTLRSLLASHTFLFIGFSLDDAYFGMQLEGIKNIYQGANGPHYVLMRRKELERGIPFGYEVRAIAFEDFGEPLLELVNELGAIANSKEPDVVRSPPERDTPLPRVADYNPRNYVFSVPFREKGDQVIGREDALQAVREQLTKGRRTSIGQTAAFQGLGGLGKTQLAVEYAYRFKDTYPNGVIWLNADQDIDAQLTELAERARWIAPESEHKYKLDIARHRLRTYSDCLIIFDNLGDPQAIENYLPEPQASPHILVTSRVDQPDFNPVPLDPLDDALSFALLLQEADREPIGDEEERAAREIAEDLDGLPLALELAGAYLRHRRHVSWQQYRDLLRHNLRTAFLPGKLSTFTKHETDLYSTLKINEVIFEEEPRLKEILDLLTWSGTSPMGVSLMCAVLDVNNPLELTNAFGLGTALRLLQKTPDVESYSIHRLVGEVRREEIPLQERQDWVDDICQRLGDWFEKRRKDFSDLSSFEAEIDHLQAWQENARQYAPRHSSRLIWLQAYPSYHHGHYQETKKWVEKALELFEQGKEHNLKLKAHLFNDLGFCYSSLGNYTLSLEYRGKALEIRRELLGEQHPDTATSLNNVGVDYGKLGDHKRALEYKEKALKIRRELLGEQHRDTAASLNNAGVTYGKLGDHQRALEYKEKALKINRELLGERHPDTAASLSNVGAAYGDLKDYRLELKYGEKALDIYRELLGEQHPKTATILNNVGGAYGKLGDHRQELEYMKKALETYRALLGERHPDTATALNNVSGAYRQVGDYKRSLEYGDKAVKLHRDILGDKHPDTILSVGNLISLLANNGRRPEAFKLLEDFLGQLPRTHIHYDWLKKLEHDLLSQTIRPGFRQPSGKAQGGKRKGKKKKRK
ncbi:MAG TPA: FxSxx-COOH system tetratricopeptide repeat protein [Pyrinomonadaceae bacterium]|nr:FxSxx-COOH system tetratricopeptide repeat protein [Pyrinomonadaceae bacterium]